MKGANLKRAAMVGFFAEALHAKLLIDLGVRNEEAPDAVD